MAKMGLSIARSNIRKIIKNAGYRYRKAKKVLTSTDPNYKDKLKEDHTALSKTLAQKRSSSPSTNTDHSR